jgi:hypothetical protein
MATIAHVSASGKMAVNGKQNIRGRFHRPVARDLVAGIEKLNPL